MSSKPQFINSKLFKLKEWLTIPETAKQLSIILEEEVTEADVLRLGLDGHLKLSVNFVNHAYAKRGDKFIPFNEWEIKFREIASWQNIKIHSHRERDIFTATFPGFDLVYYLKDEKLNKDCKQLELEQNEELKSAFLKRMSSDEKSKLLFNITNSAIVYQKEQSEKFGGKVPPSLQSFWEKTISIDGVWDIPMLGTERLDVEHRYQMLTNGPEITIVGLDGAFVEREDGMIFQVQEAFDKEWRSYRSDEEKQSDLDFYQKILDKRLANNEIDEEETEKLLKKRKTKLDKPKEFENNFYPAGRLPEDSVLVVRTQALIDLQKSLSQDSKNNQPLDNRTEKTYLNIIGAMLEITTGTFKDESFTSETKLREFIAEKFDDLRGVSTRNTAGIFAEAKKALRGNID